MTFSAKIRSLRAERGLSQQQLAIACGLTKRAIASYETDGVRAHASTMHRLANVLGVSYEYLANDDATEADRTAGLISFPVDGNATAYAQELLRRNAAMFAGGELSDEEKDAFYEAILRAYQECRQQRGERA